MRKFISQLTRPTLYNEETGRMKKYALYLLLTLIALTDCRHRPSPYDRTLRQVGELADTLPDSALVLLQTLPASDSLNREQHARWCMLQGRIVDKLFTPLPAPYHYEQAVRWYAAHGSAEEHAQMQLYLGRAYMEEGDFDRAMTAYTGALRTAERNLLDDKAGYINSYMGDLFEERIMWTEALEKYKITSEYFKKTNNTKSYASSLISIACNYAKLDSLSVAIQYLELADSIVTCYDHKRLQSAISNHLGNIYARQHNYEDAKRYFYRAVEQGNKKLPNYISLAQIYLETDSTQKAKELLGQLPHQATSLSVMYLYYQINKKENNFEKSLAYLEKYTHKADSIIYADNQSQILNIDRKYNDEKHRVRIKELTISRQRILIVGGGIFFTTVVVLILYRKRNREKLHLQQIKINRQKNQILSLSLELERKKSALAAFEEKDKNYQNLALDIRLLTDKCKEQQRTLLTSSIVYKELDKLANQNVPGDNRTLLSDRHWKRICNDINTLFPKLRPFVFGLCPDLSDSDWRYCCFLMYGFDTNSEAHLLNITPESARKKHLRLRQKLHITLPEQYTLCNYLTENTL